MRLLGVAVAAACLALPATAGQIDESVIEEARGVAKAFQMQLKGRLQAAIAEGGPQNAIGVCNTEAPEIAEDVSAESGWQVRRTALRVRNPGNAPTPRERGILEDFKARAESGVPFAELERAEVVDTHDGRQIHYMKAIPTGQVCLACHGSDLAPEVKARLEELYPQDQATGFREGELRGAFSFRKPL